MMSEHERTDMTAPIHTPDAPVCSKRGCVVHESNSPPTVMLLDMMHAISGKPSPQQLPMHHTRPHSKADCRLHQVAHSSLRAKSLCAQESAN